VNGLIEYTLDGSSYVPFKSDDADFLILESGITLDFSDVASTTDFTLSANDDNQYYLTLDVTGITTSGEGKVDIKYCSKAFTINCNTMPFDIPVTYFADPE
jgi:hypothetical protein